MVSCKLAKQTDEESDRTSTPKGHTLYPRSIRELWLYGSESDAEPLLFPNAGIHTCDLDSVTDTPIVFLLQKPHQ